MQRLVKRFLDEQFTDRGEATKALKAREDYYAIREAVAYTAEGGGTEETLVEVMLGTPEEQEQRDEWPMAKEVVAGLGLEILVDAYVDWVATGWTAVRDCHHHGNCPCGGREIPVRRFLDDYEDDDD